MLLPELEAANASWSWVRSSSAERRPLHALFSLHEVRSQVTPQQAANLIMHRVTPRLWENLGGPYNVVPVEGYRAVSVAAGFYTLVGVQDLIQELADLAKRENVRRSGLRDVWSDDVEVGKLTIMDPTLDLAISEPVVCVGHTDRVHAMCFLDHERLISGAEDSSLRMWDTTNGKETMQFHATERRVNCIASVPDQPNQFVIGDGRGEVALYDAGVETHLMRQWRHRGDVMSLGFSVNKKYMFSGGRDGMLVRYPLPDLEHDWSGPIQDQITSIATMARYEKGYVIVNRPEHEEVWSFDQETMRSVGKADVRDAIGLVAVIPGKMIPKHAIPPHNKSAGHIVVAGTRTGVFQTARFHTRSVSEPLLSNVQSVIRLPMRRLVVTAHRDGRIIFRDELTLDAKAVFRAPPDRSPYKIAISPDERKLAIAHWDYVGKNYQAVISVFDCQSVEQVKSK